MRITLEGKEKEGQIKLSFCYPVDKDTIFDELIDQIMKTPYYPTDFDEGEMREIAERLEGLFNQFTDETSISLSVSHTQN